ncbi:hypothetical protein DPMN_142660 [Dreissena polymorpha]|uniref:Uncharacterized protein n=1 Tax=Dreissena polymorpha TaxID=45954 RepID=A0A9D4GC56_DREPO|nr:hypothetical protein DPMN_142660 [Dreissena polymorpha]
MYLPTPITMPGARRIEFGNHPFMFNARGSRAGHIGTNLMTNIHPLTNAPMGLEPSTSRS